MLPCIVCLHNLYKSISQLSFMKCFAINRAWIDLLIISNPSKYLCNANLCDQVKGEMPMIEGERSTNPSSLKGVPVILHPRQKLSIQITEIGPVLDHQMK